MNATLPFRAAERVLLPYLTDTAIIQHPVRASDGALGQTTTWEETTSPCLVDVGGGGMETAEAGSLGSTRFFHIAFPRGTAVFPVDRVLVGDSTFEVTETNMDQTTAALTVAGVVRLR